MTERQKYDSMIISGLPGVGKTALIKRLMERFEPEGWKVHSIGDDFKKVHARLCPANDPPFEQWWPHTPIDEILRINADAYQMLQKGKLILDSRFSTRYCWHLPALSVFLNATLDTRIRRIIKGGTRYVGKSPEQIKDILEYRENTELLIGRKTFGYNFD